MLCVVGWGRLALWQSVWSRLHYLLSLGAVQMRLLSAAAYVSSHFPRAMVPHFNRYLIGPIFNCLTGRGGSVFIQQGQPPLADMGELSIQILGCGVPTKCVHGRLHGPDPG